MLFVFLYRDHFTLLVARHVLGTILVLVHHFLVAPSDSQAGSSYYSGYHSSASRSFSSSLDSPTSPSYSDESPPDFSTPNRRLGVKVMLMLKASSIPSRGILVSLCLTHRRACVHVVLWNLTNTGYTDPL